MPLRAFQATLARLLARNRSGDSYLAGGAALHLQPNSRRYSNDLDFFHDSEERVASAFAADRALLDEHGFEAETLLALPGFIRALVRKGSDATKVEWAHDSAWRFMPPVASDEVGYTLAPVDLAINKLLALVGRDEPRDYVDIHEIIEDTLSLGALCWAASGKDPGFTPRMLLEILRRRGRYQPQDFARLSLTQPLDLPAMKARWLKALDGAERFVDSRDPAEAGCLYYSPSRGTFVEPEPGSDAVVHFGRPGGVLPLVG